MFEDAEIRQLADDNTVICKSDPVNMVSGNLGTDIDNAFYLPAIIIGLPCLFNDFCKIYKGHIHYFHFTHGSAVYCGCKLGNARLDLKTIMLKSGLDGIYC